jgi:hypothetical protein
MMRPRAAAASSGEGGGNFSLSDLDLFAHPLANATSATAKTNEDDHDRYDHIA